MKDAVPWFLTEVVPRKIGEAAEAVGKAAGEALRDYGERESKGATARSGNLGRSLSGPARLTAGESPANERPTTRNWTRQRV
ncbi:MAG: hypothetical protein P9F75_03390 [Candidatus Contendobacter sp.]|nr:hypothetical protein [Candidatus Contendobacter sp.]